jgi:Uma2 family endonuclease
MTALPDKKTFSRGARLMRPITLEKYFQVEETAAEKSEYHNGFLIKMAGGTFNHDNIAAKAIHLLLDFVENNDDIFFVNGSDTKIRIEDHDKVLYADALVVCEQPIFYNNRTDTIINPLLVVEVLSLSTANFDRGLKFEYYKSLPSFKEYVLVHQDSKQVSVFTKQTDDTWLIKDYKGEEVTAILHALHGCPLPLKRLYRGLTI